MSIIILEGLDNCGKSLQITRLHQYLAPESYLTLKFSGIKGIDPEVHQKIMIEQYISAINLFKTNKNIILDRFILSEFVYAPMYRGYNPTLLKQLEEMFLVAYPDITKEMYLITLVDEPENLLDREDGLSLSNDQDRSVSLLKIKKEKAAFEKEHNESPIQNKLLLNIKDYSIEQVFTRITEFIK